MECMNVKQKINIKVSKAFINIDGKKKRKKFNLYDKKNNEVFSSFFF